MARRAAFHKLTIAAIDRLCADAVAVTFAVPADLAAEFAFKPGQYLTLRRGDERRSYSICASAGSAPRVGVRLVDGGMFSSWLVNEAQVGEVVEVLSPLGNFTPSLAEAANHCLIAAGSGITPVLSIAASLLAANSGTTVTLLYGNRRTDTVMFAEELADLKDRYPARVQLVHVLSREPRDVELFSGRLDADRLRRLLSGVVDPESIDQWWLCGPYGMVQDAESVLGECGIAPERVHHELFYVDEPPPPVVRGEAEVPSGDRSEVVIQLDGRQTVLTLPRDVPVLDAAQRVRGDLPFACKGGVCGTCRAKVIDGEVRMRRNFALDQKELDAGFVLTCQALPVSEHLTVDYDA